MKHTFLIDIENILDWDRVQNEFNIVYDSKKGLNTEY